MKCNWGYCWLALISCLIADEFCCKAWDSWGPLKLFGGINKGRPDEKDLAAAKAFAERLKNMM